MVPVIIFSCTSVFMYVAVALSCFNILYQESTFFPLMSLHWVRDTCIADKIKKKKISACNILVPRSYQDTVVLVILATSEVWGVTTVSGLVASRVLDQRCCGTLLLLISYSTTLFTLGVASFGKSRVSTMLCIIHVCMYWWLIIFCVLVWYGLLCIRGGIYNGAMFKFTLLIPANYPDGGCPVSILSI